jgi:hypothetical protein
MSRFLKITGIGCGGVVALIVVIIVVVSIAGNGNDEPVDDPVVTDEPTPTDDTDIDDTNDAEVADAYAVGEEIAAGDLRMTVNEVTYPEGTDFIQPDEGNRFVVVTVTIENRGDESVLISSLLQTELRDDTGQRYNMSISAIQAADGATLDGEIEPGERLRGQAGYEVPEDATGLVFRFDPSAFGLGQTIRVPLD